MNIIFICQAANFSFSKIPSHVISYNVGQGKVKFYACYNCSTTIVLAFNSTRKVYSVTWVVHVAVNEPSHSVLTVAVLADKGSLEFA